MAQENGISGNSDLAASMSFEEALTQLTSVVESLEKGELPLEEALRFYEKGAELSRLCEKQLKDAELRVTKWQDGAESEM